MTLAQNESAKVQAPQTDEEIIDSIGAYQYGWHDEDAAGQTAERGLSEDVVRNISALKEVHDD